MNDSSAFTNGNWNMYLEVILKTLREKNPIAPKKKIEMEYFIKFDAASENMLKTFK